MMIYHNDSRDNARNVVYPFSINVKSKEDLQKAASFDHVCAKYQGNRRGKDNFICSDCTMFDVDNTHSDDPSKWILPADVQKAFQNVPFFIVYSRNHMKPKGGKTARPKFHVYFPDVNFTDKSQYEQHKRNVFNYFPSFDSAALDIARFFIGVEQPNIEFYNGDLKLFDFMKTVSACNDSQPENLETIIPEGQRHNTLIAYASRVLTRFGDQSGKAQQLYTQKCAKCSPLLDYKEVSDIWNSAVKYYNNTIKTSADYIPSEQFNDSMKPQEFTDVGQADMFARTFYKKVRYSPATSYLFFDGTVWKENELEVRSLAQNLAVNQLNEAYTQLQKAQKCEHDAVTNGNKDSEEAAKTAINQAKQYRRHALAYQHTLRIGATLKEAQPMLAIDLEKLDADGFLLNTPTGTVDLRTKELKPHNPVNFCTKIASKSPSGEGKELFDNFLNVITCGDTSLAEYLQYVAGMIAVGKVFCENLIIAFGCGCNGKSTFFNLISRVLGDYSGSLSSEVLTANCRKNKSPEYAELRGKRLAIAAELEDGMQLDTSVVKKLCSTDPICAEKKYKDPFSFIPTHTVVLYTNHLPNVSARDSGTWRRLIIVPFNAVICSNQDIKNYAEYLFENAGGSVMSWIIEGAYKFIDAKYDIKQPEAVQEAIKTYREENDWLSNYITERCEVAKAFTQPSGELYQDYREYSKNIGEPPKSNASFNKALAEKGFKKQKNGRGSFIYGLRLRGEVPACEFPIISASQVMDSDGENQESDDSEIEF